VTPSPSGDTQQPHVLLYFGDVEVGGAVSNVKTRSAVNDLASAEFVLDLALAPDAAVDFFAEVRIVAEYGGTPYPLFTGNVVDAEVDEKVVRVRCGAGIALQERLMPPLASADVRGVDMLYTILRSVGFTEERMRLDGLDELPVEPFELTAPIDRATAPAENAIGHVQLLAPGEVEGVLDSIDVSEDLRSRFLGASLYARAFEVGARSFDVEQRALREIDAVLAWLAVRVRYGLARLPAGDVVGFRRSQAQALPARRDVVLLRGLDTGRRWVRVLGASSQSTELPLNNSACFVPRLPVTLTAQERQALLACRRAAEENDPLGCVTAVWDAIEFYVGDMRLPDLFTKTELKAIKNALPTGLTESQLNRLEVRLAELNAPPLLARLSAVLADDQVPISGDEMNLLRRLRRLRNAAVHGHGGELPRPSELERAISIVSRMLVFRIDRRARETATDDRLPGT
jgi:hypothetical protein